MQCKAKGQTFHLFISFNPPLLYMALYLSFLVPPLALKHFEKSCTGFLKNYTRFHVKLYWVFIFSFLVQIPHPHIFWIAETTMGILFFLFIFLTMKNWIFLFIYKCWYLWDVLLSSFSTCTLSLQIATFMHLRYERK